MNTDRHVELVEAIKALIETPAEVYGEERLKAWEVVVDILDKVFPSSRKPKFDLLSYAPYNNLDITKVSHLRKYGDVVTCYAVIAMLHRVYDVNSSAIRYLSYFSKERGLAVLNRISKHMQG